MSDDASTISHEELAERFAALFPIISHAQAEHCGYHYFMFYADNVLLKILIKAAEATYAHAHFGVHLHEDEICYRVGFSPSRAAHFLRELEKGSSTPI